MRDRRRAYVAGLDAAALRTAHAALAARALPHLSDARAIAGYMPMLAEVDPTLLLEAAAAQGRTLALPLVESRAAPLRFARWTPGDPLVEGPFGLRQPAPEAETVEPDLILAPLVGFDRALGRLGQGAAHYDRAFAALPRARRIGLAWSVQQVDALPMDPWDMPLHGIATEREWLAA